MANFSSPFDFLFSNFFLIFKAQTRVRDPEVSRWFELRSKDIKSSMKSQNPAIFMTKWKTRSPTIAWTVMH